MIFSTLLWTNLFWSCLSLKDGKKIHIFDVNGMTGIRRWWRLRNYENCRLGGWSIADSSLTSCDIGNYNFENCIIVSVKHKVSQTNELFIDIRTTTKQCSIILPKPCKENFLVFSVYESNNTANFEFIGRIPQKRLFNSTNNFISTKDIISFSRDQEHHYVSVGFNESFYCERVNYFSMYYYNCPDGTNELIEFPRKAAPNKFSSPKEFFGKCS